MELIKIYNGSLVNARELHQFLVVEAKGGQKGEGFNRWLQRMLEFGYTINKDYFTEGFNYKGHLIEVNGVFQSKQSEKERVSKREYYLTLNCAKEISMLQRNDKGKEAREYFIKCEKTLQELKNNKRFEAFFKLQTTKEKLKNNILDIGGTDNDFLQIDFSGRKVFFNGEPIPDEQLNTLLIKGRDFATELTNGLLKDGDFNIAEAENINKEQHSKIRNVIISSTKKKPEELPTEERIKKLGE